MSTIEPETMSPCELDGQDKAPDDLVDIKATATASVKSEELVTKDDATELSGDIKEEPKPTPSSSRSSSFHPKSETSTIKYEQTPFSDFSIQVEQLCHSLWPPLPKEPRIPNFLGGPNNRFLGALRTKKLGRFLWPASPPKAFDIERMSGGSFNRITGIKIIGSEGEDPISLVLRVSRFPWDSRPDREVATLEYIRRHTTIPVPHIVAFDITEENPLKNAYVFQSRIPGICLGMVVGELNHKQWCALTKELGRIIVELQKVENSTPGLIESSTKDDGVQNFKVCPFDIRAPFDMEWKKRQADSTTLEADNAKALSWYEKDTFNFFVTQFGRWRAEELRCSPTSILYGTEMHRLTDVVSAMNRLGIFRDSKNCLAHLDLAARNIMVELGVDSLKVTGILDWDSAMFVPKFVSCRPPWWLWQDEKFPEDAMEEESNANAEPDDPELLEIKTMFEDIVGDEYVRFAYQPQYLLARRLFKIALEGNYSNQSMREIDEIIQEWEAFYKREVEDYVSESSFGSAKSIADKDGSQEEAKLEDQTEG